MRMGCGCDQLHVHVCASRQTNLLVGFGTSELADLEWRWQVDTRRGACATRLARRLVRVEAGRRRGGLAPDAAALGAPAEAEQALLARRRQGRGRGGGGRELGLGLRIRVWGIRGEHGCEEERLDDRPVSYERA
jgi:hypothetical protein